MNDTVWQRSGNWVGSQIEDSYVMLNIEGGEYLSLNSTATDVWHALEKAGNVAGIVDALTAQYDVPASQCKDSVTRLLADFEAKGLIHRST